MCSFPYKDTVPMPLDDHRHSHVFVLLAGRRVSSQAASKMPEQGAKVYVRLTWRVVVAYMAEQIVHW